MSASYLGHLLTFLSLSLSLSLFEELNTNTKKGKSDREEEGSLFAFIIHWLCATTSSGRVADGRDKIVSERQDA